MVISALFRKLLRDLVLWRGQIIAIGAVTACGIATFVTMQSNFESMNAALVRYYRDFAFGDIFAHSTRAPNALAHRIAALPAVQNVQTRVVEDVIADLPGRTDLAGIRLIGIPNGKQPSLNRLFLRVGRLPSPTSHDEVAISEAFAQANHLSPGSTIRIVLNGRRDTIRVVGIALSPEYVYEMRGAADIWPDSRHFGIAWMNDSALAAAFDMTGAFNDLTIRLAPGADRSATRERLDRLLAPYGSLGAYGRDEQISDRFVSNELRQLRAQAIAIPLIFLGVAAFLINAALSRLVGTQREQIAILKAFGYGNVTIALHYLTAAVLTVGIGAAAGVPIGWWMGYRLAVIYTNFFRFPHLAFHSEPRIAVVAIAISLLAGALGALWAVRAAVSLPPAEAMRALSPPVFRPTILERAGLSHAFPPMFRMLVRTIERRWVPSLLTVIALSFAVAILFVGRSTFDSVFWMMDVQFNYVSREDATLVFNRTLRSQARLDVAALPGVMEVEPFRSALVRVSNGHRSRRLAVIGVESNHTPALHRIIDRDLREIHLPAHGVVLTKALATILKVRPGSDVTLSFYEGRRPVVRRVVAAVADELVGLNVYMPIDDLQAILHEGPSISGAYVRIDPRREAAFNRAAKTTPEIAGISYRSAALEEFRKTFAESIGISATFILGFALVIAIGVVYNSGRVALSERARDLSTLRILGYSFAYTAVMLVGEQALLTLAAIPIGFLLGLTLDQALQPLYQLEYYRVPIVVAASTYVLSAGGVIVAAAITAALLTNQLHRLDIVAALKVGE